MSWTSIFIFSFIKEELYQLLHMNIFSRRQGCDFTTLESYDNSNDDSEISSRNIVSTLQSNLRGMLHICN